MAIARPQDNCHKCGNILNTTNMQKSYSPRYKDSNKFPLCKVCLQDEFNKLASAYNSKKIGLFYFCVAFDIPCDKTIFQNYVDNESFLNKYLKAISVKCSTKGELGFLSGDVLRENDVLNIKEKKNFKNEDLEEDGYATAGKARAEKWDNDNKEDCVKLEKFEAIFSGDKIFDETEKLAIRQACLYQLDSEKCRKTKDFVGAERCIKLKDVILGSEKLRKGDENPVELDKMMGMVYYLEQEVFGAIPNIPELLEFLFEALPKEHQYKITADAADIVINDLENHYRENDGEEVILKRPDEKKIVDKLEEFTPKEQRAKWEDKTLELIENYMKTGSFDGMDE